MNDLSSLSDDQLRALYAAPDLTKMSDEELKAAHAAHEAATKTDTSYGSALLQGASDAAQGYGKTIKDYISPSLGQKVLDTPIAKSNPKYKSASEELIHPSDGAENHTLGLDWSKLPRAALEQAPGLAVDLIGQALTKKLGPVGQYVANALTYGGRTAGPEAEKRAEARTGDANAEPTMADKLSGLTSVAGQMALNKIGTNSIVNPAKVTETGLKGVAQAGGNVLKAAATEGAVNAGQDIISQGMAKRGTDQPYDPAEVLGAAATGAAGGGAFSGLKGAKEAVSATRFRDQTADPSTTRAANRVIEAAGGTDKLSDQGKAFDATSSAIADVHRELADTSKTISNPSTEAANAIQRAKEGGALNKKDLAAVDAEGNEQLSDLVRQATSLNKLIDLGNYDTKGGRFAGGVSEFTSKWGNRAIAVGGGADVIPHIMAQGGIGMDTLSASIPHIAEAWLGLQAGNKVLKHFVDKPLGLASPAKTYAQKFGDNSAAVRVPLQPDQSPTGPKVVPQNSLTTPQPWGPVADAPQKFKPDVLEPGIAKIVEKIQRQKQQQTAREAMPLLRQLAEQAKPAPEAPGPDVNAMNEQVKSALLMASARRKIEGQRQAEAEAAVSPMIEEQGGLDAVSNPAMGKRANELISAANALARLRRQPEPEEAPTPAPEPPAAPAPAAPVNPGVAQPKSVDTRGAQPTDTPPPAPEPFVLPESPHVFKEPKAAAEAIYNEAIAGGKDIRHAEGFKAGTARRLAGEERIYENIAKELGSVQERGDFHKYLAALWGSDSPEVVQQVRQHMLNEFPQAAGAITKHLSDEAIKGLWTKPARKKK